ncbi:MAG: hypothetical protein IKG00_04090 [Lachnospiraceae bacterium]|nr:hypothetical protein [Lachnospiraceae bacterium]
MLGVFKSGKFWIGVGCFAGGLFATSKVARKIAVKGMAAGMKAKDNVVVGWNNIKEEAGDIYEEAKEEAASKADNGAEELAPVKLSRPKAVKGKTTKKSKK